MSAVPSVDGGTLQMGLLLDTATKHQAALDAQLQSLQIHMQQLDAVVRDTVRRAVVDECATLTHEMAEAATALRALGHTASARLLAWSALLLLLPAAIVAAALVWLLPSHAQLQALQVQRQQLDARVAYLHGAGGHIQLQHCGERERLCVRIDTSAPAYGAQADYRILGGY